jgi:two-component system, NtrC family, response regulator
MYSLKLFVVDDEQLQRVGLADELRELGYSVDDFGNAESALASVSAAAPDVIITDMRMPGMSGVDLLRTIKEEYPSVTVILVTAYSDVPTAVEAMKSGAEDYLTKPFAVEDLQRRLKRIAQMLQMQARNEGLVHELSGSEGKPRMLGESSAMSELRDQLEVASHSDATILLVGETGTGKEVAASTIHGLSARRAGPMIKVSCAALSREVLESELFGHELGAFTGAVRRRMGRFELAHLGTILLDEIDDIPLEMQVKLLRVLEERVVERVGGATEIPIDVRIVAATKRDLFQMVGQGQFREDLYYRLNVFPIVIPPLRDRSSDIALLFTHFLQHQLGDTAPRVEEETFQALSSYHWPGNIRQLRNEADRIALTCACSSIGTECLSPQIRNPSDWPRAEASIGATNDLPRALASFEAKKLREAVDASCGNKAEAARLLGIPVTTLKSKLHKFDIE